MKILFQLRTVKCILYRALPLAFCLLFLFPSVGEAQAILLRSDPANNTVLPTAPTVVRMWFTESLNSTFSTARLINSSQQRVDKNNAHIAANDQTEMDVNLPPKLPPAVYVVLWRTQAANDGHILTGSFTFSVANPDGSTQKLSGTLSGQDQLGDTNGSSTGQLDGLTLFSVIMITLVELGAIFWVGAQLWRSFVTQTSDTAKDSEQQAILQRTELRFDRIFSLPTLLLIFLANIGVLLGQAMTLTGGQFAQAFSPAILPGLISGGNFGIYWSMRQIAVILALLATTYAIFIKQRSKVFEETFSWVNLLLGLALLIALTLSSAANSGSGALFAVLADWLHLFAAALWIGGVLYITVAYLPVLTAMPVEKRVGSLVSVLSHYAPLAIAGIVLMVITGPFEATTRMDSGTQLLTTAYGRVLIVKVLLVVALLVISIYQLFVLRPALAKNYKKYKDTPEVDRSFVQESGATALLAGQEAKNTGGSIEMQGRRLMNTLRWSALLGVAVLLCTGLLSVFAGTLIPGTATQQSTASGPTTSASAFTTTTKTTDDKFTLTFNVTPNHFGENEFTVKVLDSSGQPDSNVSVSLFNTMQDMDMGTRHLDLQPSGQGRYKGSDLLDMSGHWQVRIDVRAQGSGVSHTTVNFATPAGT